MVFRKFITYPSVFGRDYDWEIEIKTEMPKVVTEFIKQNKMTTATYHNKRDSKGRFSKVTNQAPAITANPVTKKLVNHFAFILDDSGSMQGCWNTAVAKLNEIIGSFITACQDQGQEFIADIWTFNYNSQPELNASQIRTLAQIPSIPMSGGNTPLVRTVNDAITHLQGRVVNPNDDNSYAVVVITDGQENASHYNDQASITLRIKELQKTGRWTFAFNGPYGCRSSLKNVFGVTENINEWENTVYGTVTMAATNTAAAVNYAVTRSSGLGATMSYFDVNANNITKSVTQLRSINPRHRQVEKETDIKAFFGNDFQIGKGYYELTKKELIQSHKGLIIRDVMTNRYYTDSNSLTVRQFLGMPSGDCKVDPKNVGQYRIYVQSTSDNRKLVRGTTVVWL